MVLKKAKADPVQQTLKTVLDPEAELDHVKMLLAQVCMDDSPHGSKIIQELRTMASKSVAEKELLTKRKQLDEMIGMLHDGPLRLATYIGPQSGSNGMQGLRAHVVLENGDTAFPAVLDPKLAKSLNCGDAVLLDAQARALLVQGPPNCLTGEIAELKRRLDDNRVQVMINDHTSEAYRISQSLQEKLDAEDVKPGAQVVVCTRRRMAFEALPEEAGLSHYKFLETSPVPDVVAERDIGCPPAFIADLIQHVRDEMTVPELGRQYGVRRMQTRLLQGVTGTGKTLSVLATIRGIYQVMSEITGAPLDALPPRVLRLRAAHYLSKWLGESDKYLDRFYDEMVQLANEPFLWDGQEWYLPVIARCEEIDALARARGQSEDVMGRIQTTVLERLDHLADEMGNKLCIHLFTTNVAELCDQAFIRRAGGEIIDFGRIGRGQLRAILAKKIAGLPLHPELGDDQQHAERQLARNVTNWMFSPNGHDAGQVEVTFAGSATPDVKYRHDLLTGSVVDLSIQQAAKEAKKLHTQVEKPGLTTEMVLRAFDRQISGICDQITEYNAQNYLTLPDGVRVAGVRRIDQPTVQSFELERGIS